MRRVERLALIARVRREAWEQYEQMRLAREKRERNELAELHRQDVERFKRDEERIRAEHAKRWGDFDTAQAQVTRAERELFEASPAYQRYQQMREDRERRGTGDWRLKRGDWRTP